jgi:hypothetical protein
VTGKKIRIITAIGTDFGKYNAIYGFKVSGECDIMVFDEKNIENEKTGEKEKGTISSSSGSCFQHQETFRRNPKGEERLR